MNNRTDRNFDDIGAHFAQKIYGSLKGQIRLAVLQNDLNHHLPKTSQSVLDIGAGLGQMGLYLAQQGHSCVLSDISSKMLQGAQANYQQQLGQKRIQEQIPVHFVHAPYQELAAALQARRLDGSFDIVLCHALLEWAADPKAAFMTALGFVRAGGILSLCFYNAVAPVYRNLLMGNFNQLLKPKPADTGSLTPNYPVSYTDVLSWLDACAGYTVIDTSGIRVFYDYAGQKRGGLADPEAVIAMELLYSKQFPFYLMGRYIHLVIRKQAN